MASSSTSSRREAELGWYWLGRVGYPVAIAAQEALRDRLLGGDEKGAALLLLEHDPVVTLGRSSKPGSLKATPDYFAARGVEVVESSRGGDVTYHGPGQLMIYPVVRLEQGVSRYLEAMAGALAEVVAHLGLAGATWRTDPPGLWLGESKLAACGLHVHRKISIHGFALNLSTPAEAWNGIVPCGLEEKRVTSIAAEALERGGPPPPPISEVAELAAPIICRALGRSPVHRVCPFSGESATMKSNETERR